MKYVVSLFAGCLLVCNASLAFAEIGYVVDQLLVGVRDGKNVTDKLLKVLPTGEELEVLETEGDFSKIKTQQGIEGWVESAYITSTPPAASQLSELQNKITALNQQLHQLQRETSGKEQSNRSALHNIGDTGQPNWASSWIYALVTGVFALLVGFAAGYYQRSKRQSKRLSGMRV